MRLRRLAALVVATAVTLGVPGTASAWDPSTTHMAMLKKAALSSAMHVRWMERSDLQRGLFTSLTLDPKLLTDVERRTLRLATRRAHAASGAAPLGGPGACPDPSAPASTRALCVDGDLWETTALGWMQVGVIVEIVPRARLLHHFVDRKDPSKASWRDDELSAAVLRAKHRKAGGSLASRVNRTAFDGGYRSAVGWLDDANDPWAPQAVFEHLHKAHTERASDVRDHHMAMALIGIGAVLHVVQDLSVPAHARGDATAMFAKLSEAAGDRGLPLQEFARMIYGRTSLPTPIALTPRRAEDAAASHKPLAPSVHGHLLGTPTFEGLVPFAARRFVSMSSVPGPLRLSPEMSGEDAATALLADAELSPAAVTGAKLTPWPASAGYLVSKTGRGIAAFEVARDGAVQLYLDRRIYREQANHLIPMGIKVSASLLDVFFPAFPETEVDKATNVITIDPGVLVSAPRLSCFIEDSEGVRTLHKQTTLRPGEANRVSDLLPPKPPEKTRVVLVFEGESADGHRLFAERSLATGSSKTAKPASKIRPGPRTPSSPREPDDPSAANDSPNPAAQPSSPTQNPSSGQTPSPTAEQRPPGESGPPGEPEPGTDATAPPPDQTPATSPDEDAASQRPATEPGRQAPPKADDPPTKPQPEVGSAEATPGQPPGSTPQKPPASTSPGKVEQPKKNPAEAPPAQ